jgi:hypothetical protein
VHFNKNLGSTLAVFDWAFGTLHVPAKEAEKVTFGIEPEHGHDHHSLVGSLVDPLWRTALQVRRLVIRDEAEPLGTAADLRAADPAAQARHAR